MSLNSARKVTPTNNDKKVKKSKFEQLLDKIEADPNQSTFTQYKRKMDEDEKKGDMYEEVI